MINRLIATLLLAFSAAIYADDLNLPDLGGASGGLISASQEYELGQQWQRMFRSQMQTSTDPFMQSYTEDLVRTLAAHSDLSDKRLDILVVENPALNAFAVPGGVVGVHTGLFTYAKTEQQFASVMAHELAHLSQRHFARRIDEQKNNSIPNIAAMLASILVLATAGGDAGVAAISTAQAVAIDSQLRFSRKMEQEADRLGMATMVRAGMNPYAMPDMFEQMLHASRFQRRPPEFLITHPLTQSRVSDSKLRAQQFSRKQEPISLAYQLIRTRVDVAHNNDLNASIAKYRELSKKQSGNQVVHYGLALSLLKFGEFNEAEKVLNSLLEQDADNLFYNLTFAETLAEQGKYDEAIKELERWHAALPNSHPVNVKLAETYMKAGEYAKCEALLEEHSLRRPKDDYIWYLLAEAHGLNGNILAVHTARTEYFLLNGLYDKAENHVRHAMRLVKDDPRTRAQLEEKLKKVQRMKRDSII